MLDVNYSEGARIEIFRFRQLDSRLCYIRRTGIDFSVVFGTSNSYLTQKLPRNILARGRIAIAITITSFGLSKLHKSGGGRNAGESEARRECARARARTERVKEKATGSAAPRAETERVGGTRKGGTEGVRRADATRSFLQTENEEDDATRTTRTPLALLPLPPSLPPSVSLSLSQSRVSRTQSKSQCSAPTL